MRVVPWLCVTCIGDEVETSVLQTDPRVAFTRQREAAGGRTRAEQEQLCCFI